MPILLSLCGCLFFFVMSCWAGFIVPMANDEAYPFHTLACLTHKYALQGSTQLLSCGNELDLTTPLGFALHRSTSYSGSFEGFFYAPFYALSHTALSAFVFNLFFFCLFCGALIKQSGIKKSSLFYFITFFPLIFSFLHDTGPIKLALLAYPVLSVLALWTLHSQKQPKIALYSILAALFTFACFEEKYFFLYSIPGIVLYALAFMTPLPRTTKDLSRLGIITGACALGLLFLLLSRTSSGDLLIERMLFLNNNSSLYAMSADDTPTLFFKNIFFWPIYATFVFDVTPSEDKSFLAFALLCIASALTILLPLLAFWFERKRFSSTDKHKILFLLAASVVTALTFGLVGHVWAGHHFIFIWLPLLMAFACATEKMPKRLQVLIGLLFLATNLVCFALTSLSPIKDVTSPERTQITTHLNKRTQETSPIVLELNNGHGLILSLYGDKNLMVVHPGPPSDFKKFYQIAKEEKRPLYIACHHQSHMFIFIKRDPCAPENIDTIWRETIGHTPTIKPVFQDLKIWQLFEVDTNVNKVESPVN